MLWTFVIVGAVVVVAAIAMLLVARRRGEIQEFRRDLESFRSKPATRQGRWRAIRLPRSRADARREDD